MINEDVNRQCTLSADKPLIDARDRLGWRWSLAEQFKQIIR